MSHIVRRLYLAGPMSRYAEFNYPLFNRVARLLRDQGYEVFNPGETKDGDTRRPRSFYMRIDIPALLQSDGVALLLGWEQSRGANLEVWIAIDTDLPVYECSQVDETVELTRIEGLQIAGLPFCGHAVDALPPTDDGSAKATL